MRSWMSLKFGEILPWTAELRGMFFNSCHLLDYFSLGLTTKMLFICGENPIFSDQIRIKIVAV